MVNLTTFNCVTALRASREGSHPSSKGNVCIEPPCKYPSCGTKEDFVGRLKVNTIQDWRPFPLMGSQSSSQRPEERIMPVPSSLRLAISILLVPGFDILMMFSVIGRPGRFDVLSL